MTLRGAGLHLLLAGLLVPGILAWQGPAVTAAGSEEAAGTAAASQEAPETAAASEDPAEAAAYTVRGASGSLSFSAGEYQYCYTSLMQQFLESAGDYASFLKLDPSQPLSDQECTISDLYPSWEDYFIHETNEMLSRMAVLYLETGRADNGQEGVADNRPDKGPALLESAKTAASLGVDNAAIRAEEEGYDSLADYLADQYGPLVTEEAVRRVAGVSAAAESAASEKRSSLAFTDEELTEYYEAHKSEYRRVSYLLAFVSGKGYAVSAQECIDRLEEADNEQTFSDLTEELTGAAVSRIESITPEELGNPEAEDSVWLLDESRSAGDRYTGKAGEDYFVLYFTGADDRGFPDDPSGEWKTLAENGLREETFENWLEGLMAETEREEGTGLKEAVKLS